MLYLCFRLTLERGWLRHMRGRQIKAERHFSAAVGQADFVITVLTQMQDFWEIKSDWPEKEAKVYISPRSCYRDTPILCPLWVAPTFVLQAAVTVPMYVHPLGASSDIGSNSDWHVIASQLRLWFVWQCVTCCFYRPQWKYKVCVFKECPSSSGKRTWKTPASMDK